MLAKVIAWAPTRAEAAARLAAALAGARVHGLTTNRDLLVRTLRHPDFLAGRTDTAFFDRIGLDVLAAPLAGPGEVELAALAAALATAAARRRDARVLGALPGGWRNVPSQFAAGRLRRSPGRPSRSATGTPATGCWSRAATTSSWCRRAPDEVVLEVAGVEHRLAVTIAGEAVDVDGDGWAVSLTALPRFPDASAHVAEGSLVAPMPGTVTAVHVAVGDEVSAGQPLLVLEAMKMQHPVVAGTAGVVRSLDVVPGAQVDAGAVLAVIEQEEHVTLDFDEGDELRALRAAVADLGSRYGQAYFLEQARSGGRTDALWAEAGKAGFLGVNLPEEYGGGGGGMVELSIVLEELGAAGCPLLMMVVSPAICGTVIGRFGTDEQKQRWLPGLADGSLTMAFAITEPDAGSNSHEITTAARRDGDDWVLTGRKVWICGVDLADALLVVGKLADGPKGTLRPALFVVPTDAPGLTAHRDPDGAHQPGEAVPAVPGRRTAAGRRAGRAPGPGHRAAVRGAQPRAGHGRRPTRSASPGMAMRKATDYARDAPGLGHPDRRPPGPRPPAGRLPDRDRAAPG